MTTAAGTDVCGSGCGPAVNVVVPMGGLGTRFAKQGYVTRPKPFVRVLGKEMLLWLLDKLKLREDDGLVICYNPSYMATGALMRRFVRDAFPNVTLVELQGETRGAAETVLLALEALPEASRARPTMLCDSDTFYTADIVSRFRAVAHNSNACFVFHDTQPKPIYSYVEVTEDGTDTIKAVKEKVKISDWANSGCYCFANGCQLEAECRLLLQRGEQQLSQDKVPEYYTSGVISQMLGAGEKFVALKLQRSDFHVLGTPQQVVDFCSNWPEVPRLTFAFALERSLRCNGKVNSHAADYCKDLKRQGHNIVIYTSSFDHPSTAAWLREHGIPHDHVVLGTPHADFFVDDRSVDTARADLDKVLGFYASTNAPAGNPPALTESSHSLASPPQALESSWTRDLILASSALAFGFMLGSMRLLRRAS